MTVDTNVWLCIAHSSTVYLQYSTTFFRFPVDFQFQVNNPFPVRQTLDLNPVTIFKTVQTHWLQCYHQSGLKYTPSQE
jgi:hypothetical protein